MIHLIDVDETNWRIPLRVSPAQEPYVADRVVMLARAYAYRAAGSRAFLVCDDRTPVGMGLYYDCDALSAYVFSQFFIDERYQGRGYGRAATTLSALFRYSPDCLFCGNAATVPPAAYFFCCARKSRQKEALETRYIAR